MERSGRSLEANFGIVTMPASILAYVTGTVDQELLARNEYQAAENRILRAQLKGRLKLSDAEQYPIGRQANSVQIPSLAARLARYAA